MGKEKGLSISRIKGRKRISLGRTSKNEREEIFFPSFSRKFCELWKEIWAKKSELTTKEKKIAATSSRKVKRPIFFSFHDSCHNFL